MRATSHPAGPRTRPERARGRAGRIARTGDAGVPRRMPADRLATGAAPGRRSARDPRRRPAAREAGQARRAQRLVRRPRVRGAHEGLGRAPERARGRPVPVRHPRGPPAPRAGLGGRPRHERASSRARRQPPRRFRLAYLVTAWTQRPEDEHRLLSSLLACFLRNPFIKAEDLEAPLNEADLPVYIEVGQPASQERSLADIWSALGGELKPSLDLVVIAPDRRRLRTPTSARRSSRGRRSGSRPPAAPASRRKGRASAGSGAIELDPSTTELLPANAGAEGRRRAHPGERRPSPASSVAGRTTGDDRRRRRRAADRAARPSDPSLALPPRPARAGRAARARRGRPPARRRRRPEDRFRGLYISDEQVDALLDRPVGPLVPPDGRRGGRGGAASTALEAARPSRRSGAGDAPSALRGLARAFGLEPIDVDLLLVALAPDLDPRFERLYGYLHDDVSRRRASVGLALELRGGTARRCRRPRPPAPGSARWRRSSPGACCSSRTPTGRS